MRLIRFPMMFFLIAGIFILAQVIDEEFQVNTYTLNGQYDPAIARDKDGNIIFAWTSDKQDGDITGVYARIFLESGQAKTQEFRVNNITDHFQTKPQIAIADSGSFAVVWISYKVMQGANIAARLFDPNGNPLGNEFIVNTFNEGYQGEPDIAMDTQGNFVIVWQSWDQDGDGFGIFARKYSREGNPQGSPFQVNKTAVDDQMHPSVAMDGEGNFSVVWTSFGQDDRLTGIFAQRISRLNEFLGPEFQVNITTQGWQDWPDIAMDRWGNFIICWHDIRFTADDYDIYARTFDKTAAIKGPEFRVNTYTQNRQMYPSIAADPQGNFTVCWQSENQDGEDFGIYARIFDLYARPQGSEFLINTIRDKSQEFPAVAMTSLQALSFVWTGYEKNGTDTNIYARTYGEQPAHPALPLRLPPKRKEPIKKWKN